jgi:hypothetical protein
MDQNYLIFEKYFITSKNGQIISFGTLNFKFSHIYIEQTIDLNFNNWMDKEEKNSF